MNRKCVIQSGQPLQLKLSISVTGILIMSCCCILHMYTHSINSVDMFMSLLLLVVLVAGTTAHPLTVYGKPYGSEHVITLFYAIPVSCEGRDTVSPTKGCGVTVIAYCSIIYT